jgi:cysteine desulfurase/selenocysteine lyase
VPWQIIAEEYGVMIDWVELHTDGTLDYEDLAKKLPHVKLLSITGASNVTGEVLDIAKVRNMLDTLQNKPIFIVDGSQRFPHLATNVVEAGIDIFVGTGHKVMSDTGIGFFYARKDLLREMIPAFCGG